MQNDKNRKSHTDGLMRSHATLLDEQEYAHYTDLRAERTILGTILDGFAGSVGDMPDVADFHSDAHRSIAAAICAVAAKGATVSDISVMDQIGIDHDPVEAAALRRMVMDLQIDLPILPDIPQLAAIVHDKAILRDVYGVGRWLVTQSWGRRDAIGIVAETRTALDRIAASGGSLESNAQRRRSLHVAAANFYTNQEERRKLREAGVAPGWDMPFRAIGKFLTYMPPNAVVAIYGEGGVGKSVLAECISEHWAGVHGHKVVYFQNELSDTVVADRFMSRHSNTSFHAIATGTTREDEDDRIAGVWAKVGDWADNLTLINAAGLSVDDIVREAEMLHHQCGAEGFIIDHLKLLAATRSPAQARMDEYQVFGDCIRKLKMLANRTGMRGIILHHPNTQGLPFGSTDVQQLLSGIVKLTSGPAPMQERNPLTGLVVAEEGEPSWWVNFDVTKNSFGPTGEGKLYFERPYFRFLDLVAARQAQQEPEPSERARTRKPYPQPAPPPMPAYDVESETEWTEMATRTLKNMTQAHFELNGTH